MKKVERGVQEWDESLGKHLHELLNYKANVIVRERIQQEKDTPFTKVETKKQIRGQKKTNMESKEKIIFCNDYNNGSCIHRDHHEGRWGRNVLGSTSAGSVTMWGKVSQGRISRMPKKMTR